MDKWWLQWIYTWIHLRLKRKAVCHLGWVSNKSHHLKDKLKSVCLRGKLRIQIYEDLLIRMKLYFRIITRFYNLAKVHVIIRTANELIQTTFQIANMSETKVIHFMQAVTYLLKAPVEGKVVFNLVDWTKLASPPTRI
jgi:hypothetical protein